MVSDRALNQVQGHSSTECRMRQNLFAGKDYTQKSNFSSALASRKNHSIRSAVCKQRKLKGEGLDLISFSYEFKEGIGCSHWVLAVLLLLKMTAWWFKAEIFRMHSYLFPVLCSLDCLERKCCMCYDFFFNAPVSFQTGPIRNNGCAHTIQLALIPSIQRVRLTI